MRRWWRRWRRRPWSWRCELLPMWALVTWLAIPTAVCTRVSRDGGSALNAIVPLSLVMVVLGASWLGLKNAERRRPGPDVEATAEAMRAHGALRPSRAKSRVPSPKSHVA